MRLYIAPAAAGKTAYLVDRARQLSEQLAKVPRVVVSTRLQVRAWRQRLAESGGALGIRVGTFDTLYRDILAAAGETYTLIGDPVQFRLIRKVVEEAPLVHYAALQHMQGFVQVVARLIRELKAAGIEPEDLAQVLQYDSGEPRLLELSNLYLAYQAILKARRWADYAGIGWLAAEALEVYPELGQDWSSVFVDGFDDLTTVQVRTLAALSRRTKDLIITLTGTIDGSRDLIHTRFNRTRNRLVSALGVQAEPLPFRLPSGVRAPALAHLEANFLQGARSSVSVSGDGAIQMVAAPDRQGEVREALRWLKERLIHDKMQLRDVVLLARQLAPYRDFITQTAREFGVPVQVVDGYPLKGNPAVAALLSLIRLALPVETSLPWRAVVTAWRSPYFDWRFADPADPNEPALEIASRDADALDKVARWGSVIGGLDQWIETFALLANAGVGEDADSGEQVLFSSLPTGKRAEQLRSIFLAFVQRVTPPAGPASCRDYVAWLEGLIGNFTDDNLLADGEGGTPADVGLARCIESGPEHLRDRDMAALDALKDVLRGLVWADEAVSCPPVDFPRFVAELQGAIDAATYHYPLSTSAEAVLVTNVADARGLSFAAVAILGLAEGEFPTVLSEDPLLPDRDRMRLRDVYGLPLDILSDSAEAGYFYEAFTRAKTALLLTRPRVADNGATWQASPYWEEVLHHVSVDVANLLSSSHPGVDRSASWNEVVFAAASMWDRVPNIRSWLSREQPGRYTALIAGAEVLRQRTAPQAILGASYDGGLQPWASVFSARYGPDTIWSASRLETYATCPFSFFVAYALKLEPRQSPFEGLDARQLGNIYHHIFEDLYNTVSDPCDLSALLAALPAVSQAVLDEAPRREQFRPSAWWSQTRAEIIENVRLSLATLDEVRDDYVPYGYEAAFGLRGTDPLVVKDGDDRFLLRGFIDRVDRNSKENVRVIDYKTASPSKFTASAVRDGKKLQLPLYALAAQEALNLGMVVDGFYWHVQHAQRSSLTLAKYNGGVRAAIDVAVEHAWAAIRGARGGAFMPLPPADGCPSYCPAAGFCWRFSTGW